MAEILIGFVIYVFVAGIMLGIGISQYRSKKPVAFYSGEKPPKESELSDVLMWNKKHGMMWILYGIIIIISYGIGAFMLDSLWCILPMCGGVIFPVPVMMGYHNKLTRTYKK